MARHKHTLSNYRLFTGEMGNLYPIGLHEVLPGDAFQHSTSIFMRFSPMAAPIMHPVTVRVHHFFVPHRLVWPVTTGTDGWENFITGGPTNSDAQNVPTFPSSATPFTLYDYFGLPLVPGLQISSLPFKCYNLIFNEYYRDQDLVTPISEDNIEIQKIAWEKDYFTMARPFAQKGPSVTLPLGTKAPIIGFGKTSQDFDANPTPVFETGASGSRVYTNASAVGDAANVLTMMEQDADNAGFPGIFADLSSSQAVDINTFRRAFALQRFAEARSRYGSRYVEYLKYLGVSPADSRLQRPEFLGGGKVRVSTSEVLQTSNTTGTEQERFGVGDMYGHGVASLRSNRYRRHFNEHGYQMTLMSVRPKSIYTQSTPRTFLKRTREEFWQRELEQIGQQEIWGGEVYSEDGDTATEQYNTFGYQDRYREYKEEASRVAGEYRGLLNYWHLGREFSARPVLNQSFTDCDPSKRIFNVQNQHALWVAAQHSLVARRMVRKGGASRIL